MCINETQEEEKNEARKADNSTNLLCFVKTERWGKSYAVRCVLQHEKLNYHTKVKAFVSKAYDLPHMPVEVVSVP